MELDLKSGKPLPPFRACLEAQQKEAERAIEKAKRSSAVPKDEVKLTQLIYEQLTAYRAKHPATEPGRIEGSVAAGWRPPPLIDLSPSP